MTSYEKYKEETGNFLSEYDIDSMILPIEKYVKWLEENCKIHTNEKGSIIFAVASTLIKERTKDTKMTVMSDLRSIEAVSKEEAMGKYILEVMKEFPNHNIHVRPLVIDTNK